jgi:hypothetical protein
MGSQELHLLGTRPSYLRDNINKSVSRKSITNLLEWLHADDC